MKELVIDRENKRVNEVKKEIREREKKILKNKEFLATKGNEILKIKKIRDEREKNALLKHYVVLESFEKKKIKRSRKNRK